MELIPLKQNLVPSHRLTALLKTEQPHHMTHGEALYIIWKFINPDKYWHKQEVKPYVWDIRPLDDTIFQVMFSSIHKGDTVRFMETLEHMGGSFTTEKGDRYLIREAEYLPDVPCTGDPIQIVSYNGCQCFRKIGDPESEKKRHYRIVNAMNDPKLFSKKITNALVARAKRFFPNATEETDASKVRMRFIFPTAPVSTVHYQGADILTQFVSFQLIAPPAIQKTALYGGIGKEPSSGFGFVLPV